MMRRKIPFLFSGDRL